MSRHSRWQRTSLIRRIEEGLSRSTHPYPTTSALLELHNFRIYNYPVRITYDPPKRDWTLAHRGLDFDDAETVFDGLTAEVEDTRKAYGETRIVCFGLLAGRLVVIGYTPRGDVRHVFSMRKANDREQARFKPYFGF
jgi:uncharacterized DUF497 family protein